MNPISNNQSPLTDLPDDVVLSVRGVSKKFCRNLRRSMLYGMQDLAKNMLGIRPGMGKKTGFIGDSGMVSLGIGDGVHSAQGGASPSQSPTKTASNETNIQSPASLPASGTAALPPLRPSEFWALQNISFDLRRGEVLGLIGSNGCGKSTLLRILMGILPPDTGEVLVRGRMGGLVALGAGMHPHMTGRENIVLNGTILGMSRAEILSKSKDIADFADIGDFLDTPVTTYSSGMHVRLGFAIAIHCLPDVVVLDEVLAVGDAFFQRKCLDRIRDLQKENKAFILVSHNMTNIDAMCGRTLLLSQGVQCCIGPTGDVLSRYELMLAKQLGQPASTPSAPAVTHGLGLLSTYKEYGTNDVRVRRIELLDEDGRPQKEITDTKKTTIRVSLSIPQAIEGAFIWVILEYVTNPKYPQKDVACVGTRIRRDLPCGDTELDIHFGTLGLATGMYKLAFNIFDHSNLNPYTQGRYGYIDVRNEMPTLMRTGSSLPFIWIKPDSDILTTHRTQTCPTQSEVRSGQPPSYS